MTFRWVWLNHFLLSFSAAKLKEYGTRLNCFVICFSFFCIGCCCMGERVLFWWRHPSFGSGNCDYMHWKCTLSTFLRRHFHCFIPQKPVKVMELGTTLKTCAEFHAFLQSIQNRYTVATYDLIKHVRRSFCIFIIIVATELQPFF
jgi:hypothetical protein